MLLGDGEPSERDRRVSSCIVIDSFLGCVGLAPCRSICTSDSETLNKTTKEFSGADRREGGWRCLLCSRHFYAHKDFTVPFTFASALRILLPFASVVAKSKLDMRFLSFQEATVVCWILMQPFYSAIQAAVRESFYKSRRCWWVPSFPEQLYKHEKLSKIFPQKIMLFFMGGESRVYF